MFLSVRSRRRHSRYVTAIAIAALVLVAVASARGADSAARHALTHRVDDARDRAAAARARERDLGAEIDAQSRAIDGVEARVRALGAETAALERRLAVARAEVARLERLAAAKSRDLRSARREFGVAQRRLHDRVVELYVSGEPQLVEILIGAASLEQVVEGVETRERVIEQDLQLAAEIRALRTSLARERRRVMALKRKRATQLAALTAAASRRRAAYAEVVVERDRLQSLRTDRRRTLASVSVDRERWEQQAIALQGASSQVAAAAVAPTAPPAAEPSGAVTSPPPSGGFVWPVRGTVVSPYGQRWGRLHAGVDIAAPAGTPIVASASGRVTYSGTMSGYGLIVVIQHAGGVATAYAHNSRNAVSVGQSVSQGQVIASVGCTGTCFGDHVHFEVRVGGNPVDPMGYL